MCLILNISHAGIIRVDTDDVAMSLALKYLDKNYVNQWVEKHWGKLNLIIIHYSHYNEKGLGTLYF